jgi:uncharacterized sodium:solute symporter family permease YidK
MNPSIPEEVGQTARSVVEVMKESPLSLALVVMNMALVIFLFYSNNQVLVQRQSALNQIVEWQKGTDTLMASCVSIEVMKLVVDALERDRSLYRQMLPHAPDAPAQPEPKPQSDKHILFRIPP